MSFEVGDRVIISGAMNSRQDGAEGIVQKVDGYGPDVKITRLPDNDGHDLYIGRVLGYFESSVKISPRIVGQHINAKDVRRGDKLRVAYKKGTLEHTVIGVSLGAYNEGVGHIYAESGVLFDNRWDQSSILLLDVEAEEHPLERAKPGDRFKFEVEGSRHTLQMAKYSQGFWIREAYKDGLLTDIATRTEQEARNAFDKYNGKLVK